MQRISLFLKFLRNHTLLFLGGALFIVTLAGVYGIDILYRISTVEVKSYPQSMAVAGIPAIKEKNILLVSEESIREIITDSNPTIKTVEVTKQFPDTIILAVEFYRGAAYLMSPDGYILLGAEGRVLAKTREQEDQNLPVITYYQRIPFAQYQAGDDIPSKDIKDGIYFLHMLSEMKIKVNSIDIAGFHMLGLYTDKQAYFFSSEKDRSVQVYNLEQAIKTLKSDRQEYRSIDVRFDKPVITL